MSARVRIVYCAECGYEPQTLALADALMRRFGHDLASIEIVPWLEGTFEVSVDGRLVHSMARDGGFGGARGDHRRGDGEPGAQPTA